jgi:hypothetical protein
MFSEVTHLKIKVRTGARGRGNHHLELVDIVKKLEEEGYSIKRVERGRRKIPVIDVNLRTGPADATEKTLPIHLRLEPCTNHRYLNVQITLSGLLDQLNQNGYGVGRRNEFSTRVFIPGFDDGYLTPNRGDDPDNRPRDRVMGEIVARRGAQAFRDSQLERFRRRCAISGCTLVDVLEAAHIRAYRAEGDNDRKNGILLRSDLHTLFDLDLLAVHPANQSVAIHESVIEEQYRQYHGRDLSVCPEGGFDAAAVKQRWAKFSATCRTWGRYPPSS